jgi:transcriptional regulator with XRE-family HTH domain
MATQGSGSVTPTISTNIRHLAKAKGLSLKGLAEKSGISERSFFRKLNVKPGNFTLEDLGGIAKGLEVRLSELIADKAA